jgi:MoaD family protein
MINVTVKFFTTLREITETREKTIEVEDEATVEEVLDRLRNEYGRAFEEYVYEKDGKQLSSGLQFLVDGRNIFTISGQKTKLSKNSVLAIIPPIEGGCAAQEPS